MTSRRKNPPDYNASKCGNHETFGRVYISMLRDPAFINLSLPARQLYTVLRGHATSSENRKFLYMHGTETGTEYTFDYFVFPPAHQVLYGYKDRANVRRYLQELLNAGFIRKVEDNRHRFTASVYRFAAEWKD